MASATQEHLQNAAQGAKTQANEQKNSAASSLGGFAGALRKAAKESEDGSGQVNRMAEWAADGLERVSSTLRNKDMDGMLRDAQSFARQQPVAFFAAAVAAGFLASRFLKAGTGSPGGGRPQEAMPQNFPPPGGGGVSATEISDVSSTSRF